jgi:hypothetical protein
MASVIGNLLGANLLDGVSKVINSIRGKNPEDAAKLEQLKQQYEGEFLAAQESLAKAQIDSNVSLNQAASANIQAEAKGSWYTAAARPSIIWTGLGLIVWNYAAIPTLGVLVGLLMHIKPADYGMAPIALPDWFWSAWKVIALGYVFARTADKASDALFGGAGGSLSLPLGIKMDSKGDK